MLLLMEGLAQNREINKASRKDAKAVRSEVRSVRLTIIMAVLNPPLPVAKT